MFPQLRSLHIRDFKGIAELDLTFDETLTVLAGVNGVGKTSVIQAALGIVTHVHSMVRRGHAFEPPGALVRYGASEGTISAEIALGKGEEFEFEFTVRPTGLEPRFSSEIKTALATWGLKEAVKKQWSRASLIVYYDQNRIGGLADARRRVDAVVGTERSSIKKLLVEGLPPDIDGQADERHRPSERKSNRAQALDTTPHTP